MPPDDDGHLVGANDILAQVGQVVANTGRGTGCSSSRPRNVVRSVIYVVSDDPGVFSGTWDRLAGSCNGQAFATASTLLGVATLGYRGLVESN